MSLTRHAKSAVVWNASFNILREGLLRIGTVLIFRRMLSISDYGVFSFVNNVIGFLSLFGFANFVAYTVQVREDRDVHWQEQFTAGGFFQLPLFVFTNLVAVGIRWIPAYAPIAPYLHAVSLTLLLDWPCEFRRRMLERAFNWKRLRILQAVGLVVAFLVQLNMALAGMGAYALLLPVMVASLPFIYDLFFREKWRPDWSWSWKKYRPAWRFGWTRIASGLVFQGKQLIESAVIVSTLGLEKLGILGGALALAQVLCQNFANQLLFAIYAVLTRVNPDHENVSRVNALVLRAVAWVTIPMALFAGAQAGPLLLIAYGPKWAEAVPLIPWGMAAGGTIALAQTANTLLLSKEKLKLTLMADILVMLGTFAALFIALPGGLKHYLAALTAVQVVVLVVMLYWLIQERCLKVSGVLAALLPAFGASAAAYGGCQLIGHLTRAASNAYLNAFTSASVNGVVFGLIYLLVLRFVFTGYLREIVPYIPKSSIARRILLLRGNHQNVGMEIPK
jgi:PST family polysaccharide transporter